MQLPGPRHKNEDFIWEEETNWFLITSQRTRSMKDTVYEIFGHGIDYIQFLRSNFQTSHVTCPWWEEGLSLFWVMRIKYQEKREEIWLRPMTKALIPTEKSKKQSDKVSIGQYRRGMPSFIELKINIGQYRRGMHSFTGLKANIGQNRQGMHSFKELFLSCIFPYSLHITFTRPKVCPFDAMFNNVLLHCLFVYTFSALI